MILKMLHRNRLIFKASVMIILFMFVIMFVWNSMYYEVLQFNTYFKVKIVIKTILYILFMGILIAILIINF